MLVCYLHCLTVLFLIDRPIQKRVVVSPVARVVLGHDVDVGTGANGAVDTPR